MLLSPALNKTIAIGVSFLLLGIGSAAIFSLISGMAGMSHGGISICPLTASSHQFCAMTLTEHLSSWQQIFTATVSIAAAFLVALSVLWSPAIRLAAKGPPRPYGSAAAFFTHLPAVPAPSGVSRALIRGIIHPKRFVLSVR